MNDRKKQIIIGSQLIHDGETHNGKIYFTQVDRRVIVVNSATLKVEREVNLVEISKHEEAIGWWRGIKPLSDELILVGFSRIRPSRREKEDGTTYYVGDYGVIPTRLACYNIQSNTLLWKKTLKTKT
ncbi:MULTISPECIES: hypothetical protein [Rossellomorea]|uniref:hypothetical protein n=1 Tax=Rossellomorea TaxID=2837508 RepID=UPI001CCE55D0|nr:MULTISPECIES: hypothetical protein [Rossellomorea]MCA0148546.1 hypothetical protein [Rossellomorea vietnamensis]WGG47597.1 hypothetical protein P8596_10495 [Rossellomorea sp. DA94]